MGKKATAYVIGGMVLGAVALFMAPNAKSRAAETASTGSHLPSPVRELTARIDKPQRPQRDVAALLQNYERETQSGRYIVILREAPVPSYRGTMPGFPATNLDARRTRKGLGTKAQKLDPRDVSVVAYRGYLRGRQDILLDRFRRRYGAIDVDHRYQFAANGFSARMSGATARRLAGDSEVQLVEPVRELPLDDATTPAFIGAERVYAGEVDGIPYLGEGMVIGILDSGINHFHPSFSATGDDGYTVQPPPGLTGYLGECASRPELCNDKLIGAYVFDGTAEADIVEEEFNNPASADIDGHGSHVAATAAGNVVFDVSPPNPLRGASDFAFAEIKGVAPHANIVSFKVCHVRSCPTDDILAAMNQAIADGVVDVVNKSISSASGSPWADALSLAYLEAREAGIFVANSAGNSGPDAGTAGRINSSPWVAGVAATTHPRGFELKALDTLSGGDTPPPLGIVGRGVTASYTGPIVYAGDFDNLVDDRPEQCLVPFPEGTFNGEIVVCDRGEIARVQKGVNVLEGGAGGFILANLPGEATSLNDDIHALPAIHIDATDGEALKTWLATGADHIGTIEAAIGPINDPVLADQVIDFSSAGPYEGFDILAPNIAAPGVDILAAGAGLSDQVLDFIFAEYPAAPAVDTVFGIISGTSMASPHVAGAAALVKQASIERGLDLTDAEILSALQTTATRQLTRDGESATPLDVGAGRIRVDLALRAGLVLDETVANFRAADPEEAPAGSPRDLNVVGLVDRQCVETCQWTRTVRAVTDETWDVSTDQSWLSVTPSELTLAAGDEGTITVVADVTQVESFEFRGAEVLFTPRTVTSPEQHLTVSVRPSAGTIPQDIDLVASREQGSRRVSDVTSVSLEAFSATVFGPTPRVSVTQSADGDSDPSSPYDDPTDGAVVGFYEVPAEAMRFVAETFDSESSDLDLFVGIDLNGNGVPEEFEELCSSATPANTELCDIPLGGENPALTFWVLVQNWQASEESTPEAPDSWQLGTAIVENVPDNSITVAGPTGSLGALEPYDLDFEWNLAASPGDVRYGWAEYFADASGEVSLGASNINFFRVDDDSSIGVSPSPASVGDEVTVEIPVGRNFNEFDRTVTVTHDVPAGLTLVGGSVTQGGAVSGSTITWSLTQPGVFDPALQGVYSVTTSNDSPDCVNPLLGVPGYANFSAASFFDTGVFWGGDGNDQSFFLPGFGSTYFNRPRDGFFFTSEGFLGFLPGTPVDAIPVAFPNMAAPNDVIAGLWNDWTVVEDVTDPENKRGMFAELLAFGRGGALAIQYADVELGSERASFELYFFRTPSDAPGAYEAYVAYGPLSAGATGGTGLENEDGTIGTNYAGPLSEGLVVCYDFVGPSALELSYRATVDPSASGELTLESTDSDDVPNTVPVTRSTTLVVENDPGSVVFAPASYTVNEDATVEVFVERIGGQDGAVSVEVSASAGTATAGSDYTAVNETLSWAADERGTKSFIVTTLADADSEGVETIALTLANPTGGLVVGDADTAVVSIADAQDPGVLALENAQVSVSEAETSIELAVVRTGGTLGEISVSYATADGTASAGEDYTSTSGTLTFGDGVTRETITVPLVADGVFEGDETFTLELSAPVNTSLGDVTSVEVTIEEDDDAAEIGFASASATVDESAGTIVLSVERTQNANGEVTVDFATADATATAGEDYTEQTGTLTWTDQDSAAKEIVVPINDDSVGEPDETFVVELTNVSSTGVITNATVTVSIVDDDTKVRFVTTDAVVAEDAGSVSLDVERTGSTAGDISVDYRLVAVTATPADYVDRGGTLSWSDAEGGTKQIEVEIIEDSLVETDQEFIVELVNPIGAALGTPVTASVTIEDNDSAVELELARANVAEDAGTIDLRVLRVGSAVGAVSVDYATENGSAAAGSDYVSDTGTLSWSAGDSSPKTVTLTVTDDALSEAPETFALRLSNPQGIALGEPASTVVTIVDDDVSADTVGFAETSVEVSENAGSAVLTVTRTAGTGALTIAYSSDDGSAFAGEDYNATSGTIEWLDGEVDDRSITVPLIDDEQGEMPEDFFVFIPGTGAASVARVSIIDDRFEVGFASDSLAVSAGEADGTVAFTLEASGDGDGGSVDYAIVADTAGTADVINASGTVQFAGGDLSPRTITVEVVDDDRVESEEALFVVLRNPTQEATLTDGATQATLTITDDDAAGAVELASAEETVEESAGAVTLTVNRVGGIDGEVSVNYETVAGTADATDFTAASGSLTWADQDGAAKSITVDITSDDTAEEDETFSVVLSNPMGEGASLGAITEATVTITETPGEDDEGEDEDEDAPVVVIPGNPFVTATTRGFVVDEDAGEATVSIALDAPSPGMTSVSWSTADGTAREGSDYTGGSGTVTWMDGDASEKTFTVAIIDDSAAEGPETFEIDLDSAELNLARRTITVLIDDDDVSAPPSNRGATGGDSDSGGCAATPLEPLALLGVALLLGRVRRRRA